MPEELELINSTSEDDSMPRFGDAERLLQETKSIFDRGDYVTAIVKATDAIDAGTKALNDFYGIGLTYAIRSSESMISNVKDVGIDATSVEQIQEQAKQTYETKNYEVAGTIIAQLKDGMNELHKQHSERVSQLIDSVQSFIADAKVIGTDVTEAESILQNSRELLAEDSLTAAVNKYRESESQAKTAYQNRVQGIGDMMSQANDAVEEARFLNSAVSEAEQLLEAAKNAFEQEDYGSAIENANNAIQTANDSRDAQIQKALSIQEKIKVSATKAAAVESPIPGASGVAEEPSFMEKQKAETMIQPEKPALPTPTHTPLMPPSPTDKPFTPPNPTNKLQAESAAIEEPLPESVTTEEPAAEPTPPEKPAIPCPKCSEDMIYVEQYQKYYCYTCSAYRDVVEEEAEEKAEPHMPAEDAGKVCPNCDAETTYVEQYQKYYCYKCEAYVEPAENGLEEKVEEEAEEKAEPQMPAEEEAKMCPTCSAEAIYVEQYQKYYCYTCETYVEPIEKTDEATPSTTSATTCPTCSGELKYVKQYDRNYCYTCSKYI